jgi:hypothetical protein
MTLRLVFATIRRVCERSFNARITEFATEDANRYQFSITSDDKTFIVTVEQTS